MKQAALARPRPQSRLPGRRRRRWLIIGGSALLAAGLTALSLFPGQRLGLAFTLATGLGTPRLQRRIDTLEAQAIAGKAFSREDRAFLSDFYRTLATGAKLTLIVGQTGRMMDHYLDGSGVDYRLEPEIFRGNAKVQAQLAVLRAAAKPCIDGKRVASPTFYMPDSSQVDSVFGLYHGTVTVTQRVGADARCTRHVRAEVPWIWPTYASLLQKHGSYHAESFPLPNLKSLLLGRQHALFVDNGLGQHLATLRLAQPFLAYAEWNE